MSNKPNKEDVAKAEELLTLFAPIINRILRDVFAAVAMHATRISDKELSNDAVAANAYAMADGMLTERDD